MIFTATGPSSYHQQHPLLSGSKLSLDGPPNSRRLDCQPNRPRELNPYHPISAETKQSSFGSALAGKSSGLLTQASKNSTAVQFSLPQHVNLGTSRHGHFFGTDPASAAGHPSPVEEPTKKSIYLTPPSHPSPPSNYHMHPDDLTQSFHQFGLNYLPESSKPARSDHRKPNFSPPNPSIELPLRNFESSLPDGLNHAVQTNQGADMENYLHPGINHPALSPSAFYYRQNYPRYPFGYPWAIYPPYSPYHYPSPIPVKCPPSSHLPVGSLSSPREDRALSEDEFYRPLSNLYQLANEPELNHLLTDEVGSILKNDPFSYNIGIDFGFGPLASLSYYGIDKSRMQYSDALGIDDLYFFEAAIRNDELLTDQERLRRWNHRLNWENISSIGGKKEAWNRMTSLEQARIGVGTGGWWAYFLFSIHINSTYGYYRLLVGEGSLFSLRPQVFRRGSFEAHYPLSGELKLYFPIWRDGGFGLGRSLIHWLDGRPVDQVAETVSQDVPSKPNEAPMDNRTELINRKLYAEHRLRNMVDSIWAQSVLNPPSPVAAGYRRQPSHSRADNPHLMKFGYLNGNMYGSITPNQTSRGPMANRLNGNFANQPPKNNPLFTNSSGEGQSATLGQTGVTQRNIPGGQNSSTQEPSSASMSCNNPIQERPTYPSMREAELAQSGHPISTDHMGHTSQDNRDRQDKNRNDGLPHRSHYNPTAFGLYNGPATAAPAGSNHSTFSSTQLPRPPQIHIPPSMKNEIDRIRRTDGKGSSELGIQPTAPTTQDS